MPDAGGYRFPRGRLLVFARQPVVGKVKTRLAAAIGDRQAAQVYRQLVRAVLDNLAGARLAPLELYVTPALADPFFDELAERFAPQIRLQQGGDLGERMFRAMQQALEGSDFAVLVGTDCPVMGADYLCRAFSLLQQGADVVLGPAEDGGYVLLGTRDSHRLLFEDIPWGSDRVLTSTRQRIQSLALNCRELEALWDVDRPQDLRRWQADGGLSQRLATD